MSKVDALNTDGTKALKQKAEDRYCQSVGLDQSIQVGWSVESRRSCEAPGSGALIGFDRYYKSCCIFVLLRRRIVAFGACGTGHEYLLLSCSWHERTIQSFRCKALPLAMEKVAEIYQQNILREYPLVTTARPVARRRSCDAPPHGIGCATSKTTAAAAAGAAAAAAGSAAASPAALGGR